MLLLYPWPGNVRQLERFLEAHPVVDIFDGKTTDDMLWGGREFEEQLTSEAPNRLSSSVESESSKLSKERPSDEELVALLAELGSYQKVAKRLGVTHTTVIRWLKAPKKPKA